MQPFSDRIVEQLKSGAIGVIPTDTLYGLVCCASNESSVERVYAVRDRDANKSCIILIADVDQLGLFDIVPSEREREYLNRVWPGKVSVVLPVSEASFAYLRRGESSLAFRLPDDEALRDLIRKTGPLIAPSANPQGMEPATTIEKARAYFGDRADFYVDGGTLRSEPSTLIRFENGKPVVLRQGAVDVSLLEK